ncbi:MAG: phosphate-starvation-inducible PsiE family protein, partial [Gaiellaceae bacterium]
MAAPPAPRGIRRVLEREHRPLVAIDRVEAFVHYVVAVLLLAIAAIVLAHTVEHLVANRHAFATQATTGINDLLFVVIVMELLRTVVAHLETDDFQLNSFLIVGIISAVRHILGVGAQLTLTGATTQTQFLRSQIELGVSAAVVLEMDQQVCRSARVVLG